MRMPGCIFEKLRHMLRPCKFAESVHRRPWQLMGGHDDELAGVLMAARLDSVCKYICDRGGWQVTNLQLQKILYLAQLFHMGQFDGSPLVEAQFEAWDYGPVEPSLYRKVRMFGAKPIQDVFLEARRFKDDDSRKKLLDEVCDDLLKKRAGELVEITHWEQGAWARHYEPGARGIEIPDADIHAEYHDRIRAGRIRLP